MQESVKQSKGITEKMLNAIISNNDISKMENSKDIKSKPMISPNSASPLNPYLSYGWLFKGLGEKKKN